jgi:hypothetical protein
MQVLGDEHQAIGSFTVAEPDTAQCDLCGATDTSVVYNNDNKWFPVLACNSFCSPGPMVFEWQNGQPSVVCDGINHRFVPFNVEPQREYEEDCYWWYQGNYKNGWVYWMGDWRCGPCTEKTIIGPRS